MTADLEAWEMPVYIAAAVVLTVIFLTCLCNPCGKGTDVLQRGETMVHRRCGKGEAKIYKYCMILCILPLYVVLIWMSLLAFGGDIGVDVMNRFCGLGSDHGCRDFFSLGLTRQDRSACQTIDTCDTAELLARSGSEHSDYVPELGLGKSLAPVLSSPSYECTIVGNLTGCVEADPDSYSICDESNCTEWDFDLDEYLDFTIGHCVCTAGLSPDLSSCDEWECEEIFMEYFFPNVVFSLLMCALVLFPCLSLMCYNTKMQCGKKLIPCRDPEVVAWQQGGGLMSANNLASGPAGGLTRGLGRDKDLGVKDRSFSRYDCLLYLVGSAFVIVSTYLMWVASGFLALVLFFLCLIVLIIILAINTLIFMRKQRQRTADRIKELQLES